MKTPSTSAYQSLVHSHNLYPLNKANIQPSATKSRGDMVYGGSNDIIGTTCPRCRKSPDTHKPFPFISAGEHTRSLINKFSQALHDSAMKAYLKDCRAATTQSMMGAAVVTIGSSVNKYVTLSGTAGVELLAHFDRKYIGEDVEVIDIANAAQAGKFLNNPYARKRDSSVALLFTPVAPTPRGRNRDYPLGSCAAQKLIMKIYDDANEAKADIKRIEMAELLWFDTASATGGHNRDWSTGQIVCSCDTCKQILPQILCSNID